MTARDETNDVLVIEYADCAGRATFARARRPLCVGRGADCAIRICHPLVSRHHLELTYRAGCWLARDLDSRNGTLLAGRPIREAPLTQATRLQLGADGPFIQLTPVRETLSQGDARVPTLAFRQPVSPKRRRLPLLAAAGVLAAGLSLLAAGHLFDLFGWPAPARDPAADNWLTPPGFHTLKSLELERAGQGPDAGRSSRLTEARARYEARIEDEKFTTTDPRELAMQRLAWILGEYPFGIPAEFTRSVVQRIQIWQTGDELTQAIRRLNDSGFLPAIHRLLTESGLPAQCLYLGLVASGFRPDGVGPAAATRGFWSLTAEQARRQGLRVLSLSPSAGSGYDPRDERHALAPATLAMARSVGQLQRTAAQGSWLLALALHLDGMEGTPAWLDAWPATPAARNVWTLLDRQAIPPALADQVTALFAAALIGENPRGYGFDFDNPLHGVGTGGRRAPRPETLEMIASIMR